jgi:predicted enzyme related to lactoylglutathione lyase
MEQNNPGCSLEAVLFTSSDPETLAAFYEKGFELAAPKWHGPDHLGLNLPNTYLGFDRVQEGAPATNSRVSIWFRVADIEATFERLVRLGAKVKYAPTSEESPGEILAMLYDPDDNCLGLISSI